MAEVMVAAVGSLSELVVCDDVRGDLQRKWHLRISRSVDKCHCDSCSPCYIVSVSTFRRLP
jgi:hypothetical protein